MTLIKVKSIKLYRAEGRHPEGYVATSYDDANKKLRHWAHTAPDTGGYDKTDFTITFEDGETYNGRFDLQHHSSTDPSPSLEDHVRSFVYFLAGLNPGAMSQEAYQNYLKTIEPDLVESAKEFIQKYDIGQRDPNG